jgi:hypothetical protein
MDDADIADEIETKDIEIADLKATNEALTAELQRAASWLEILVNRDKFLDGALEKEIKEFLKVYLP